MSSTWFKRIKQGILTSTKEKKNVPDGLWFKCPGCKKTSTINEIRSSLWVCPNCNFHNRIDAEEYFEILFDDNKYTLLFENILSRDMLGFVDLKPYKDRLVEAQKQTGLKDAMTVGTGEIMGRSIVIACMNFSFIGGSMGSVVGEKISRGIDYAIANKMPFMIISKSGGARMMESAFSLMQMAKTSAKLTLLAKAKLPYISFLTDPTTGGVTASYAMLGDLNIAEPAALIGFAGPRVIKETIKKDLPEGFQRSEFLLEHGFLDFIVDRKELKQKLADVLDYFKIKNP
ncbi:MAG: acetyl-CoA carboxylase carboxyltransferase subunit beta [Bacteroidetes bacterium]|jgi:acetyl-CoA carboxylase carboxyl transferase subunit beta|nr:acetyl-CoA carboxylase carboxyltransferase subunit beta [Bacteroidota bacterium]HQW47200.1 acetyl-CoA carboxylase, carboxyltransferase subunit beta [Chitinophagaceae bacterium]MBK6820071.1 acetyl-CoA carboxylase carboxyltransferase subunit beta [Bacteroidota bacterium]MBK7041472.1 acetyl-CoA carboxylase carboxyltransferase subunit beta [Bacteroidota bacterium]MBK7588004.1 acetyl-CoA carboxylase carboxyltransferase subunit beta [Bacteroidota bacterium]